MPYHLIDTEAGLADLVKRIGDLDPALPLGVDTETTGLRPEMGDRIVGSSFSLGAKKEDDHFYIPVRHKVGTNVPLEAFVSAAWDILGHPTRLYVFQNAKFDLKFFRMDEIEVRGSLQDTLLLAHLLLENNETKGGNLRLKTLCKTQLGEEPEDQKALNMHLLAKFPMASNLMEKMAWGDPNVVCQYACSDTRLALGLYDKFLPLLTEPLRKIYEVEIAVTRGLVDTELRGVPVDREWLATQSRKIEAEMDILLKDIQKEANFPINPLSGPKVYNLITQILGIKLPNAPRTATGRVSLKDETLEAIKHPLIARIREYRKKDKLVGTYLGREHQDEKKKKKGLKHWITDAGFVHPNLNQTGTPHARFSAFNPNLQNQPPEMRPAFLVRPGYRSFRWDYSQIEMRIFAHYANEALLIDGYNSGRPFDIHGATATELRIPRPVGKTINFLIIYGGGATKLASNLAIPLDKARAFLDRYYARFPGVKRLRFRAQDVITQRAVYERRGLKREVVKWGWLEDLFGRRYYLPPNLAYRAVNRLVAGCAATLMKHSMAEIYKTILPEMREAHGPEAGFLLNNIHDELEIEMRRDVPEDVWVPRITQVMEDFHDFKVPIKTDLKITDTTWADIRAPNDSP